MANYLIYRCRDQMKTATQAVTAKVTGVVINEVGFHIETSEALTDQEKIDVLAAAEGVARKITEEITEE